MNDITNLTELADLFPDTTSQPVQKITLIAPRFWEGSKTREEALRKQQESFDRIQSRTRNK